MKITNLSEITAKLSKIKYPGQKIVRQLHFLRIYWQLVNKPTDTALVFKLGDALAAQAGESDPAEVAAYLEGKEHFRQMLKDRYLAPDYKVEDLAHYPPGTLGHAYYTHMTSNGFTPDFFPPVKVVDEISYMELRGRQTHDIWHVMTGYGVDVVGEIALQAFYLGQTNDDSFAMMLISTGCLYSVLHEPKIMGALAKGIGEGYARGRAAKNFYPIKWEEMWHRSLAELQAEMNVLPLSNQQVSAIRHQPLEPALSGV